MKKLFLFGGTIIVVIVGYWLISPIFFDKEVIDDSLDEETEAAVAAAVEAFKSETSDTNIDEQLTEEEKEEMFREMAKGEDKEVDEPMPVEIKIQDTNSNIQLPVNDGNSEADVSGQGQVEGESDGTLPSEDPQELPNNDEPAVVSVGEFVSVAHHGEGFAKVINLGGDKGYILRFEDFEVSNGPDLRVLLSKNSGITNSSELGEMIEIGKLKGNIGTQNYSISSGINLSEYKTVVIYCKPFRVVFNTAELK